MNEKLFIEDLQLEGKKVLVRVDFNVPLDDDLNITSNKRVIAALPTIKYLVKNNAQVILMSHLGRPKGERISKFSLKPVFEELKKQISSAVYFTSDCIGDTVNNAVDSLKNGEILLLENLRYHKEETDNDANFAKQLASIADIYINDAFGTAHRAHASTEGITKFFNQNASGYLMKKELDFLDSAIKNPKRPFAAIIGGAKISGKIDVLQSLLEKVDTLIVGGGMAFTFFKAQGKEIGKSLLENDKIDLAKQVLEQAKSMGKDLILPIDCQVTSDFSNDSKIQTVSVDAIPSDKMGLDIGPDSITLFTEKLIMAKTIVWNGPMGVFEFENFAVGTTSIAQILAKCTDNGAITIIGGGDSASAIEKAGLSSKMSHISTGGGASLEFLEGKVLPGVALTDK